MPHRITREEAVARIQTLKKHGCTACALRDGELPRRVIAESTHAITLLSGFPRTWGHLMILLKQHRARLTAVSRAEWADVADQAWLATRCLDAVLQPRRCYVASLGTNKRDLPLTFPHVHMHVVPIYSDDDRPRQIFSCQDGVWAATDEEWQALQTPLIDAWNTLVRAR